MPEVTIPQDAPLLRAPGNGGNPTSARGRQPKAGGGEGWEVEEGGGQSEEGLGEKNGHY